MGLSVGATLPEKDKEILRSQHKQSELTGSSTLKAHPAHDVIKTLLHRRFNVLTFFSYKDFVCLYMEIICPNTVKYGTVFRRF